MNSSNSSQNASILFVDDEEMVLASLKGILTLETDYDVVTFTSPVVALQAVPETHIDLVVADYLMPEMTGIDFLLEFKKIYPDATRILLTAYADKQNAIRAINELGLYRYIEKPWDNEDLLVTIRNALERRDLISDLRFQMEKERRIRSLFQRYVPEQIIREVLNPDNEDVLMENSDKWAKAFDRIMVELEQKQKMEQDLQIAREIQERLLPENMPQMESFEIASNSIPAREVSGDFYDYLSLGDHTGIVLADVTGKSVQAALVAAMTNGMLHSEVEGQVDIWDSPGKIFSKLNTRLQPRLVRSMFTAMFLCVISPENQRLVFSNAGMPYPIVKRGNEAWELKVNGMPLGLMKGVEYEELDFDMEVGDFIAFCSDGIIEAINAADEMYQTERLLETIKQADPGLSAQEMMELIVRNVTEFIGDVELSDDITIVVLRCTSGN